MKKILLGFLIFVATVTTATAYQIYQGPPAGKTSDTTVIVNASGVPVTSANPLPVSGTTSVSGVVSTGQSKPYCLAASPTVLAGYYVPTGVSSIVSVASGVGAVLTITESDATSSYITIVNTTLANITTTSACAVK